MSNPTQILVVDDDPLIREVMSELLSVQGYEVRLAATGIAGLKLARELRPALVLLDVRLPDLDGKEVCRRIKTDPSLEDMFVVLFSGEATGASNKVAGLEVGADEYLTKPVDVAELLARIRTLLRLRNALAAHKASEAALRVFLDAIGEPALMVDRKGTVLVANQSMARNLGHSVDNITGRHAFDLFPPDIARPRKKQFDEVVRTGQAKQFEDAHGNRHFLNSLKPVLDAAGKVSRVALFDVDITERKKAETVLRASEARLRLLNQQVPAILWTTDLDLQFTSCTGLGLTTLNLKTTEVVGRSLYQFFDTTEEDFPAIAAHRRALGGERSVLEIEWGKRFWSANIEPLAGEGGKLIGCVAVAVDITERKLVEEESRRLPQRINEAQESERLRVARELHDGVNQLLASAKMRLRNVEENFSGFSPAAREILRRCSRLLVQALEENRRIAHDLRPSDLDELGLVAACRNLCTEFQTRTNLVVKSGFPRNWKPQPPTVELNLFRIVQEVLTNVEKHAQAKTVRLRLSVKDGIVALRIRDDGQGWNPNVRTAAKKKRRGIGLTNLRERAAALGGTCEFVSVPNQGTTITVRVPFLKAN